jgi:Protein of unknown function (DUF3293)
MCRELFEAYQNTSFCADTPDGRLRIRVSETNAGLDRPLVSSGLREWAYVTACNPGSVMLSDIQNRECQAQLEAEIARRNLVAFVGEGIGGDGRWPPERSLLVLGIGQTDAICLGRKVEQMAIVVGVAGEAARLVPCDTM